MLSIYSVLAVRPEPLREWSHKVVLARIPGPQTASAGLPAHCRDPRRACRDLGKAAQSILPPALPQGVESVPRSATAPVPLSLPSAGPPRAAN